MFSRTPKPRAMFKQWYKWIQNRPSKRMAVTHLELPDKSEGDKKQYRILNLSNGVNAMLISDPTTPEGSASSLSAAKTPSKQSSTTTLEQFHGKLAACAVLVNVGSFSEPYEYPGMAHFLEHMIFMGSTKYPEENAFDSFIAKCGGFSNAHTENEDTCFYFEVEEQYLDKTMDMFMNLMKSPLMRQDSMTRERSAVQSEFEQVYLVDEVRRDQILASMAGEGYPHRTFSWGNMKSLKEMVDDDHLHQTLHEFRRKHYGSNRMKVCLQATLSLDELEELLVRHCSTIPQSDEPPLDISKYNYRDAFQDRFFKEVLLVQPMEDVCKLEMTWVLPPMRNYYKCKPDTFIAHLLGYEGVGSLCSYLRRRLWCMSIMSGVGAGSFDTNSIYSLFNICIHLTDEGFAHLDDVIAATFAWIRLINECNTLYEPYGELQQIAANNFRFQIEIPSMDNVQSIVDGMRFLPPKDALTGSQLYFDYDEAVMQMVRQHLTEFRFNIMISSHIRYEHHDYDRREPWFGTYYTSIGMPDKWQEMWHNPVPHAELTLPQPNPFVTTDFTLQWLHAGKPHLSRRPKPLIRNDICELWFRQDDTFLLPDGYVNIYMITPIMRRSARDYVTGVLFTYLVEFYIAEELYPALMAGLTYGLDAAEKGLILRVSGYNQKLPLLIDIIVRVMKNLVVDVAQVMSFRELKKRQLFNAVINSKSLNLDLRLSVLEQMRFTLMEKYEIVDNITVDDILKFRDNFYKQMYVQALIQGNFTEQEARDITQKILNTYENQKIDNLIDQHNRIMQLPMGEHYLRVKTLNGEDPNTIIVNYYQIGPATIKMEAMLDLVDLIVEEPFFNQLRTKEQLCYSLGIFQRIGYGIMAYMLIINTQETKFNADYVDKRLEAFRLRVPIIISELSDEEFEQMKDALLNNKRLGDHGLFDEMVRNWGEIVSMEYVFNRNEIQIQILPSITKQDILEFLAFNQDTNMRKLSVQVVGSSKVSRRSLTDLPEAISDAVSARHSSSTGLARRPGSLAIILDEVQRNISEEQLLFEQIGDRIHLEFIGDTGDDKHIMDVAAFKKKLFVYPHIVVNPKYHGL
ncbi:nardilysin [Drosophila nasuta]|uniref:nardilysin n=1 Tax=Drosophila nasuta TaxID=42062 RepID=UPI00295E43CE|nr:nardilysin [Drosophila nasuta]XP_060660229.1 nardilysin [Drosophila nasuta]